MFKLFTLPLTLAVLLATVPSQGVFADGPCEKERDDRGNRCEGLIDLEVSRPDLVLLSFAGHRELFDDDVDLKVKFFLPRDAEVVIQGRELRDQRQYRMESKAVAYRARAWNEFGPWPTGEVLTREGIPASNLGVLIEVADDGRELAPAFVYHSELPASVDRYTLILRPNKTLSQVTYTLYRLAGDEELEVERQPLGSRPASRPFPIRLDAESLDEGPLRLVIEAAVKNRREEILRQYDFYHKPLPRGGEDRGACHVDAG